MAHLEVALSFLALVMAITISFFSSYFPLITPWVMLIGMLFLLNLYFRHRDSLTEWLQENFILQYEVDPSKMPYRSEHDKRRFQTYPTLIPNTWYHLVDSDELTPGRVMEVRALNRVFVVWRAFDGSVVCQDAFCTHQGANLGVLGSFVSVFLFLYFSFSDFPPSK